VNRTRPLPPGLVYELLTEIEGELPPSLQRQRLAAKITGRLNLDARSSLRQRVRTPTCPAGYIKDNSVRRLVTNSLTDGALYDLARETDGRDGLWPMVRFVSTFWRAVTNVFPEATALPPRRSRLSHGVGVVSMGYVMDHLYASRVPGSWSTARISSVLRPLEPHCAWTTGHWRFSDGEQRPWDELQNLDRDIRRLSAHLVDCLEARA
jgi:hypothetical protein